VRSQLSLSLTHVTTATVLTPTPTGRQSSHSSLSEVSASDTFCARRHGMYHTWTCQHTAGGTSPAARLGSPKPRGTGRAHSTHTRKQRAGAKGSTYLQRAGRTQRQYRRAIAPNNWSHMDGTVTTLGGCIRSKLAQHGCTHRTPSHERRIAHRPRPAAQQPQREAEGDA